MPKSRNPFAPVLTRTDDPKADRNLRRVLSEFDKLAPMASGRAMSVTLEVGVNKIRPPMKHPRGAAVTYQSVAGPISQLGMSDDGYWQIDSTVACTATVSFH